APGRQECGALELLDALEVRAGRGWRAPHLVYHGRLRGQLGHRRSLDAARLRPYRSDLRIEDDQDRDEVPRVADRDRLADDRARLRERLQVGGRDVLARGGDDQLLLAVDDLELPVRPRLGDVAA